MTTLMVERTEKTAIDDLALARNAIADVDAFAALYRQYVTRVYRYHMAHTGNIKDAEDLTSQTFLSALEGLRSYRGDGSFAAWILGIAAKKRLMYFRGRKPEIPLDAALHIPSPGLPTDKEAYQRLRLEAVSQALRKIPVERAEAVVLSYFGGLSNQEIGAVLRKSEAAVKMLVSRGLQDLRERTSLEMEAE
ncbi:MAG: ECF RNA polymerase sigma factor SigE [Anaerolineales bacterium]|nr:ECF RNA polymerase sigma factor SigE [Anaerolineales bacterium]